MNQFSILPLARDESDEILRSGANIFSFSAPRRPHWCPQCFRVFFLANETLGPLLARAGSYISLESFLVLREKETHEHKPTANIACDINEGKRKIKSNSCVRFARSALAAVSRKFFPYGSSYVLLKKLCRDFRLRPAAQRESVMRDLSKIWDTVNVKFLSTVRPSLRALGKIKNFQGAQTKTPTKTEQTTQETRFQRHTTHTHTHIPTNTRRKYFCN